MPDTDDSPSHDGLLRLHLPEHGNLELPLAGLGGRLLASLIDHALLFGVALLMLVALTNLTGGSLGDLGMPVLFAIGALTPVLGPMLFELSWDGQTPGKRWLHLRVLSTDGTPAAKGQILLRNVLRVIDFLPLGYLLGVVTIFISPNGVRLGDLVAGTVIVREDTAAFAAISHFTGALDIPPELRGLPHGLLRGARLLTDPSRQLSDEVRRARAKEICQRVREHRPDLATEDDDRIWQRLTALWSQR